MALCARKNRVAALQTYQAPSAAPLPNGWAPRHCRPAAPGAHAATGQAPTRPWVVTVKLETKDGIDDREPLLGFSTDDVGLAAVLRRCWSWMFLRSCRPLLSANRTSWAWLYWKPMSTENEETAPRQVYCSCSCDGSTGQIRCALSKFPNKRTCILDLR